MLDYGIIGNCKTCALVKKDTSIDWMCFPTFSSPSVFAKILDQKNGGYFQIKPVGRYKVHQAYIPYTAILETTFDSPKHSFKVIDFFPRYRKLFSFQKNEKLMRQNRLIRIIKKIKGRPRFKVIYEPRPNYALDSCLLYESERNLVCKNTEISLISNLPFSDIIEQKPVELVQTRYLIFGQKDRSEDFNLQRCMVLFNSTKRYWENWVDILILPENNREMIIRSAITLKLMTYSSTGAIIAAPTTSIPEEIGVARTWDYRYCWIRDSVFCVDVLKKIGRGYEAKKLLKFFIDNVLDKKKIQIMYGIEGETLLNEKELSHLEGFKGTKPVRIGNAAYEQVQHDIYGEIIDLIYLYFVYYQYEPKMTRKQWRFLKYIVRQIKKEWKKKDSGIWEFRQLHEHFTFSKLICYIGVDRAVRIAQYFKKEDLARKWLPLSEEIRAEIIEKGYNKEVGAFTLYYGSKELDASLLLMAYHEFLEKNDSRLISTIKAIYRRLRKGYLVQRYSMEDDLGRSKSAFTICAFWLVDALYYIGEEQKARKIFNKLVKLGNHLGLFAENIDLNSKKLIGNFPQAYTHIALINSAILLSEWSAKRRKIDWSKVGRNEWF